MGEIQKKLVGKTLPKKGTIVTFSLAHYLNFAPTFAQMVEIDLSLAN